MQSVLRCSIHNAKTMEGVLRAMEMTDEVCRELQLAEKVRFHLRIITEEICTNAYEYCLFKCYDYYCVYWKIECNHLTITVSHQGEFFPLPSLFAEPKLGERGRGLLLIQSLVDDMQLEKQGDYIFFHVQRRINIGQEGEVS